MMDMEIQEEELSIPASYDSVETARVKLLSSGNGNIEATADNDTRPLDVKTKRVIYKECQKNHAANIGGHATDGCGEFMPSGQEGTLDALRCAACDCHRNFHRRQVEGEPSCDCQYFGRDKHRANSSMDLPDRVTLPLPSSTMLGGPTARLACTSLSTGISESEELDGSAYMRVANPSAIRKRFRTKFTAEQKEKLFFMAEKLGWRIQKQDEAEVQQFCSDVGVKRHVLKVWMHNNKQTLGKKL